MLPVLLILIEGLGTIEHVPMPSAPPTLSTVAAPYLVLPTHEVVDMNMMLWSTDRFADLVNGGSGLVPTETDEIRKAVTGFPDARSVTYLRSIGVRTVVVLPDRLRLTARTGGDHADRRLGLTREVRPDAVVSTDALAPRLAAQRLCTTLFNPIFAHGVSGPAAHPLWPALHDEAVVGAPVKSPPSGSSPYVGRTTSSSGRIMSRNTNPTRTASPIHLTAEA